MMTRPNPEIDVYLEIGQKKVIAGAVEWPGWCRIARSEAEALQALLDYAPRYAAALDAAGVAFLLPVGLADLNVVERLAGTSTTDFGAPDAMPEHDKRPFTPADYEYAAELLRACWLALDTAVQSAANTPLTKGPRGGGRDLDAILTHVYEAENAYLRRLGRKPSPDADLSLTERLAQQRQAILEALAAAARGELPQQGPRGGKIWPARYYVRRAAWHVLDHAWEIEDRAHIANHD
ncbi:MAG: hypothetical protein KBE23_21395 [Chloroflexi bacterium]|nr:hypothetical protein [Chloroflexota bacterium]MBP7045321.1 hypothetical protein [Chloroflexota bacterium]